MHCIHSRNVRIVDWHDIVEKSVSAAIGESTNASAEEIRMLFAMVPHRALEVSLLCAHSAVCLDQCFFSVLDSLFVAILRKV